MQATPDDTPGRAADDGPADHEPAGRPPGRPMIELTGLGKVYPDGTVAVHDLDLDVRRGELVCLVGPSGCGKSTTLKMINRLIEPTRGRIFVDGQDVTEVDPVELRRGIGYVIQQVGLFPHQRVAVNVATVLTLLGTPKAVARAKSLELLELVGLDPDTHADRYPHQLSGGQRQRVGVAHPGRGPARAADGRALRRGRPGDPLAPAGRVPAPAGRARQDRRAGDARHRRGRAAG
ncbi:MAG: ATP-binding cassette domain-containing protein [Nocardioides sp.]